MVSQLLHPCKLQKRNTKKGRGPVMAPLSQRKERLWLIRHQRSPKGWYCCKCPSQMGVQGIQPQTKWEGITFTAQGTCVVLARLKAIIGNNYYRIWRDCGFWRKPNHCKVVWKHDKNPGWDTAWMRGCPLFLPSVTLKGKGGKECSPLHSSQRPAPGAERATAETAVLWLWLAAEMVIQWEVFYACREQCPDLPCAILLHLLTGRHRKGRTRDCVLNSVWTARAALRATCTYLQANLSTQSATVLCHFSLALHYVSRMSTYQCDRGIWSGWA